MICTMRIRSPLLILALLLLLPAGLAVYLFASSPSPAEKPAVFIGQTSPQKPANTIDRAAPPTDRPTDRPPRPANSNEQAQARRVIQALAEEQTETRLQAVWETGMLDPQIAVGALQARLLSETDPQVRQAIEDQLAATAGPYAVQVIIEGLGQSDPLARSDSLRAYGRIGESAVPLLGQALLSDPQGELRQLAAQQLARIATPAALALLQQAAQQDSSLQPMLMQAQRQGFWDATTAPQPQALAQQHIDTSDLAPGLIEQLDPQMPQAQRLDAIVQLPFYRADTAANVLASVLRHDPDLRVREESLYALQQIDSPLATTAIAGALADDSPQLRQQAMALLWGDAGRRDIATLGQTLFSEPSPVLRLYAVQLLGSEDSPAAQALLAAATRDADPGVSAEAQRLLRE